MRTTLPSENNANSPDLERQWEAALIRTLGDRYRCERVLQANSASLLALATDVASQQLVVVKGLNTQAVPAGMSLRLQQKATLLQEIESPCLPEYLPTLLDQECLFLIAKHMPGETLAERVKRSPLPLGEALAVGRSLFTALTALHGKGVLHSDLKPANIILNPTDSASRATLVDIGPSLQTCLEGAQSQNTLSAAWYLSPEQAGSIDHDLGPFSDLYAAGAVLFDCLAGRPPFEGNSVGEILFAHMTAPAPELRALGLEISRALDELVQRLLRKDPRDRYQSAEAVLADLDAICAALDRGEIDPQVVIGGHDVRCSLTEPAFVARARELESIDRMIARTQEGNGGLVVVEAESGGGKSRLLAEIARQAARRGLWVLRGEKSNEVGHRPLQILDGVINGLASATRTNPRLADSLRVALGAENAALVATMPQLSEVLGSGNDPNFAPEAFGEARSLRALSEFLHAIGTPDRPTLILLDDCQWADELTWKLLQRWQAQYGTSLEANNNVMIVAAFRSEEVPPEHLLRKCNPSGHLALAGLSREEIVLLATSMAGPLPDAVLEVIVRLADSSPFMASAVVRGLVECGAILADPSGWRVDETALASCQSSNRAATLLTRRVELLDQSALELLSVGAVLGKEFDVGMAVDLLGTDATETISSLDEARRRQLIWLRPDQSTCVFVHDKVRETLLDRISEVERQGIHLRAAWRLREIDESRFAELAFHFDAAGDSYSALSYAMQAAEQARAQHALEIAEQQYRIAQRGADAADKATRFRLAEGLGDVLLLRGRYDQAAELFALAVELAEGRYQRAHIRGRMADLAFKRGDMDHAVRDFENALRTLGSYVPRHMPAFLMVFAWQGFIQLLHTVAPKIFLHRRKRYPTESERLTLQLFSGLAHGSWYARSKVIALWAHMRGLNLAETYLPTLELAHAYSEHAPGMTLVPLFERGIAYAQKSLEIRKSFGDLWGQGQSLHYYGVVLYAASRFSECIVKCREAVRLLERMGDYQQVHTARYQIAAALYHLGDFRAALEEAKLNHRSGIELGDEQASGINLDVWARADHGNIPNEVLELELQRERFDAQGTAQVLLAKGVCLLEQGNTEGAIAVFERAISVTRAAGVRNAFTVSNEAWLSTAWRQEVEHRTGYNPAFRRRALKAAGKASRRAIRAAHFCRNDLPQALREYGLICAMRGKARKARRLFDRSLAIADQLGERYEIAQTLTVRGRVGQDFGWSKAAEDLERGQTQLDLLQSQSSYQSGNGNDLVTLSLADRFDTVLDSGRKVASALRDQTIYEQARLAALRLLRGQKCSILEVDVERGADYFHPVLGDLDQPFQNSLIANCLQTGSAVAANDDELDDSGSNGSSLCAPVFVRGRAAACIYVTNAQVSGLFGEDEQRLADFVACIAGAALENAEGFQQLQDLNATLEQRVEERTAAAEERAHELAISNNELERTATELRKTEEELRIAMLAAESANQAKSKFLATMSHEIRTPMNGILGMTELALATRLSSQQQSYLKIVKQSGDALLTLLNDILDLSKIEAGKMELESIPFNLQQVVGDATRLLAANAFKKGLELIVRVAPNAPEDLVGDPNRLRQIVVNLVGNAVKFTERGEIVVNVEVESIDSGVATLHVSVKDTGIGIPADKQAAVFEAFQQSDTSTTRKYGGTGLGLSISVQFVKLMQGRIWLESVEGEGTTFHFNIPLQTFEEVSKPLGSTELCDIEALVVSTNATNRTLYAELLETHQARVTQCASVAEARQWLERNSSTGQGLALLDVSKADSAALDLEPLLLERGNWNAIALMPPDWVDGEGPLRCEQRLCKPATHAELFASIMDALHMECDSTSGDEATCEEVRSLNILLADDGPVNREVAVGLLQLQDHQVTAVTNGLEAVEALEQGEFDVVLMDVEMPVMDGLQAARTIRDREDALGIHTPIVAMTAHAIQGVRDRCREAGMDAYVTKPIQPDELFRVLTEVAAGRLVPALA